MLLPTATTLGIDTTAPAFTRRKPEWVLIRDFLVGAEAMKSLEHIRTPAGWDKDEKAEYVDRASLFNATAVTVKNLAGMVTVRSPVVDVDSPAMDDLKADLSGSGQSVDAMADTLALALCGHGFAGLLTDFPPVPTGVTQAVAAQIGARPVVAFYDAPSILEVRTGKVGGRTVINRVRLSETVEIDDGLWGVKQQNRVRALDMFEGRYRQRVFVQSTQTAAWSQEGEDIFPLANGEPMSEIPFRLVSADGNQFLPARPPMHDLAELNRDHLNNSAALERSLFYCGSPMWFIAGMAQPEGGLRIGSSSALFCGDPQAKASVVQSGAESIGAIASQMTEKREQMAIIGARFLSQEASQVAVETAQIHRAGDTASLSTISGAIEDALTQSLKWCALFMGANPDFCKVTLSRDYMPRRMNFQELTALVASWQSGAMPTADLYDNLVKGEIVTARQGGAEEYGEELESQAPVDVGDV